MDQEVNKILYKRCTIGSNLSTWFEKYRPNHQQKLRLFYIDQEVNKVFIPKPMVSFRSARKLSSYLVRAKLYSLERKVSSFKCKGKKGVRHF